MNNEDGFTLVEILVAAAILSIGIAAALAVQWNALSGYTQSRDTSHAARIGRQLIEIMRVESQQWGASTDDVTSAVSTKAFSNSNFSVNPLLGSAPGGWTSVFTEPVDIRLNTTGNTRFCAYIRGKQDTSNYDMVKVHVAVVFPKSGTNWSGGTCDTSITSDLDAASPNTLELTGYSAVYMGTVISRRDFM